MNEKTAFVNWSVVNSTQSLTELMISAIVLGDCMRRVKMRATEE